MKAIDLLDDGRCSAACLLSAGDRQLCDCRCRGEFHGRAIGAEVNDRGPWWVECSNGGWSEELLSILPQEKWSRSGGRPLYRAARDAREVYQVVTHTPGPRFRKNGWATGNGWGLEIDASWAASWRGHYLLEKDLDALLTAWRDTGTRFLEALMSEKRITAFYGPGHGEVVTQGFRLEHEARVALALLGEALHGNLEGIARAIAVLEGHPDPVRAQPDYLPSGWLAAHPVPGSPEVRSPDVLSG